MVGLSQACQVLTIHEGGDQAAQCPSVRPASRCPGKCGDQSSAASPRGRDSYNLTLHLNKSLPPAIAAFTKPRISAQGARCSPQPQGVRVGAAKRGKGGAEASAEAEDTSGAVPIRTNVVDAPRKMRRSIQRRIAARARLLQSDFAPEQKLAARNHSRHQTETSCTKSAMLTTTPGRAVGRCKAR